MAPGGNSRMEGKVRRPVEVAMSRYRVYITSTVLLICIGVICYLVFAPEVRVTVWNTGQEIMGDVTIHVTGRAYSLGDLAPGVSRAQMVSPTSESHVEVEFTDEQDSRVRLKVDCYFEPGYR